jgi:hypothetical protein
MEKSSPQLEAENRKLIQILEGFIKTIIVVILGLGIALFTLVPDQKERNLFYYAKRLGLSIVSQISRLFPQQYDASDKWRARASQFISIWNSLTNAMSGGAGFNRREGDQ